ncbi:MAG TPA: glucose 1-dehydrogenase [Acidimicrobiia bacterium]|jgi:NAD(P)-dependent dehydrogenase (short-subunit alcohol dehydrogenase family)|nr:glucose 1-dehydrogenase [Acidimicrobiia bacterium]
MDLFDLSGRVAVVTGGNKGIGLGLARGLARAGASVALWARDLAAAEKAVQELEPLGDGDKAAFECDVSDEEAVLEALDATIDRFGQVDSAFANAGTTWGVSFPEMELSELEDLFQVNVGGVFLVAREVARHLIARDAPGSIVITSSIAAHHGLPTAPHYSASKGAATALARALAVRLARHRIRVNVLAPGWVETEMTDDMRQNPRFEEALRYRVPLRRWGTASDFEGAAVFLASDASAFMTGAELILDGGYSAF